MSQFGRAGGDKANAQRTFGVARAAPSELAEPVYLFLFIPRRDGSGLPGSETPLAYRSTAAPPVEALITIFRPTHRGVNIQTSHGGNPVEMLAGGLTN